MSKNKFSEFSAARGGDDDSERDSDRVPSLRLSQAGYIQVAGGVHRYNCNVVYKYIDSTEVLLFLASLVCLREELLVATGIGWLQRIRWDGLINSDMTIEVSSIPFSVDLQLSRGRLSLQLYLILLFSNYVDIFVYFSHSGEPLGRVRQTYSVQYSPRRVRRCLIKRKSCLRHCKLTEVRTFGEYFLRLILVYVSALSFSCVISASHWCLGTRSIRSNSGGCQLQVHTDGIWL